MKAEADVVKRLVDTVTSDNIEQVNKIERSLLQTLNGQNQGIDEYINYLNGLIKTFFGYLSPSSIENLTLSLKSKSLVIRPIPETSKPVLPVFSAGQYSKEDVAKLLGRITVPNTKPENRKIKPMELKHTRKQRKLDREKSDVKQKLSLSSSVTKVMKYTVPGVDSVCHVSLGQSGRFWVSDDNGNLVQTDLQWNKLQKIQTSGGSEGYHTVTQNGDLIYTDQDNKAINRITPDNTITQFIKTGGWKPLSIHSSNINGDILVGMNKENLMIQPIPETFKPVPPVFTAGQYSKEDIAKLLGRITVPNTKPENRKIKPMETASTELKLTGKQDREKSDVKQTLSLSSAVTKAFDTKSYAPTIIGDDIVDDVVKSMTREAVRGGLSEMVNE
uniref:Uncharacterized protein n=1 Tax=Magallana gigas TaxID=29159 RepID=K1QQ24_MAGGI